MSGSAPLRIALIGAGAIGARTAQLLSERNAPVEIVGVAVRSRMPPSLADRHRMRTPADLQQLAPDLVVEAAGASAVREWGVPALRSARMFAVSSSGALADQQLLDELRAAARAQGSRLVLSPGAIGGIDALAAAARGGLRRVEHRIIKHPSNWDVAPDGGGAVVFRGSAREAARRFPLNANVTVVSALAGVGLDETIVELVADPAAVANRHEIRAEGEFGTLSVTIENRRLESNPRSSELAALALVRLIENEAAEFAP